MAEGLGAYWLQDGGSGAAPSAEGGRLVSFACFTHDKSSAGASGAPLHNRRFRLADFCADPTHVAADGGRFALEVLLSHAMGHEAVGGACGACGASRASEASGAGEGGAGEGGGAGAASEILLKMPGPVAESMGFRLADGQVPMPGLRYHIAYICLPGARQTVYRLSVAIGLYTHMQHAYTLFPRACAHTRVVAMKCDPGDDYHL